MKKNKDAKKGLRLHNALLVMFLSSFGMLLVFLLLTLVPRVTSLLEQNAVDRTKETVMQSVKSLDIFVDNLLTSLNYSAALLPMDIDDADKAWQERLSFMDASRQDIAGIAIFSEEGALIYGTAGVLSVKPEAVRQAAFFQKALERQGTAAYFSQPHMQHLFDPNRTYVISMSRSVEYLRGGTYHTGVILMDVNYKALRTLIDGITLGKSGYAYLIDEADNLVCHPYENQIDSDLMTEDTNAVSSKILGITNDSANGKERVLITAAIQKTRWRMVGVAYIDEMTTLQNAFIRILSIVMLCAAILSFACATSASHLITHPITVLESTMQKVTRGDLNVTMPESGFLEIRSVVSAFNHMLLRIRALMDQIVVEQEKKRLHELNALQAQINPHFLYNTLDSIIWMEERGHGKEAIPMVSALARLFRIAISKGKSIITVSEELEHVRNYLIIQKMRFKDKFSYTIEASDEALLEDTIKLIVQPIVENCINHAIDQTQTEELHIEIRAFIDQDNLYFTIRDDGVGISAEKAQTLITKSVGNSGIGIKNVHERIMLTYGAAYGIAIDSVEDQYTLVTLTLPRKKEVQA